MKARNEKTNRFNWAEFYATLDQTREHRGVTWRCVSEETGVCTATLSRLPKGHRPDLDSMVRLVQWAGLDLNAFISGGDKEKAPSLPMVLATLHTDPNLTPEAAAQLASLIHAAYRLAVGAG